MNAKTIEVLVGKLNDLPDEAFGKPYDGDYGTYGIRYAKLSNDIVSQIDELASELLIIGNGRCNWNNIRILKSYGFDVYAGEKDSFGWITGCIEYPDGERVVIYG